MTTKVQIGTVTVQAGTEYTHQYECAAWHKTMRVTETVTVPIMGIVGAGGKVKDWPGPSYTVAGRVVSSDFTSLWGGMPISGAQSQIDRDLGEPDTYTACGYAHAMAKSILEGGSLNVTLQGFQAIEVHFEYPVWDRATKGYALDADGNRIMEPCMTYALVKIQ